MSHRWFGILPGIQTQSRAKGNIQGGPRPRTGADRILGLFKPKEPAQGPKPWAMGPSGTPSSGATPTSPEGPALRLAQTSLSGPRDLCH